MVRGGYCQALTLIQLIQNFVLHVFAFEIQLKCIVN